jgi:electron transfer flavoprotein alpha subunit
VKKEAGILILAEVADGKPIELTNELLGLARRLVGELGGPVSAAVLGSGVEGVAQELITQGTDRVYVVDDESLAQYQGDAWVPGLAQVAQEVRPTAILLGQNSIGLDLAPRLAFRLGTAVAMDCVAAMVDGTKLLMTRPCYGGKAQAVVSFKTLPVIATMRMKSQDPLERDNSRTGDVVKVSLGCDRSVVRTKTVCRLQERVEGVRLEDAKIVIAGGLGLNGPEGFRMLEELAEVLDAAVGASRAACDLGWYPYSQQIGLTGKVVAPDLYVAVGISGASQHMSGCAGAKTIVAINKDPEAGIFKAARFGVVGDYKQVVPPLTEEIRKLKS